MTNLTVDFTNLDIGGQNNPISVEMETIEVQLTADEMVTDYAKAFVREAHRVNPLRAEQVKLTEDEMVAYAKFLLVKRLECVNNDCKDWRSLKLCYIPVFLQYALRMVGKVILREQGLTLMPVMEDTKTITLKQALEISEKVGAFERDLQVVQDAMPRDITGDQSVMSTALIAGYVRALRKVDHVSDTYVSAFLGFKLKEEAAFRVLYRVQYDDIQFIYSALTASRALYG
jgi:hypothetical protein